MDATPSNPNARPDVPTSEAPPAQAALDTARKAVNDAGVAEVLVRVTDEKPEALVSALEVLLAKEGIDNATEER